MRRLVFITVFFSLMITACAAAAPTEPPSIIMQRPTPTPASEEPTPKPGRTPSGPAEAAVIKQLAANLALKESDISVLRNETVEFKDSCLGMAIEEMLCSQVITPGNKIVLEAKGVQYEYRTSRDGGRVQPATLALIWKREGGIAGFCDTLTV